MTEQTDERAGWSSASNAAYDRLCPGRHLASRNLPDETSDVAESGNRIHAALSENARNDVNTGTLASLSGSEREVFDSCRAIEKKVLLQVFSGEPDQDTRVWKEQRYWSKVPDKIPDPKTHFMHSGKADYVTKRAGLALILDYKTGMSEAPASSSNEQLRDLAVMVGRALAVDEVIVAIVQPTITSDPELCRYSKEDLARAEQEMWDRVRKSNDPSAPRVAGDVQCKYCKAAPQCKEHLAWASSLLPEKPSPFTVFMSDWTPEQRSVVADHIPRLRKLLDDSEDYLKSLLKADPEAVPGFQLKDGQFRESITDPQELFNRFLAMDGNLEQFMACVKITKGELEDQVRAVTKTKGKELKSKLESLLVGITEKKQNAPSLAKIKDKS